MEAARNRANLDFPDAVFLAFKFLIDDFSFVCVRKETTFVRFESNVTFVNVYHGRTSFELNVEIGEQVISKEVPENPFTIEEILSLVNAKEAVGYHPYQVHTADAVKRFVTELARLVKQYAIPTLIGDHDFFRRLSEMRTKWSTEYMKRLHLNRIRTEVDAAWQQKNYTRVIELYDSMRDDLIPVEVKKLEYAKKRIAQ
jgi:hypothetical protein